MSSRYRYAKQDHDIRHPALKANQFRAALDSNEYRAHNPRLEVSTALALLRTAQALLEPAAFEE